MFTEEEELSRVTDIGLFAEEEDLAKVTDIFAEEEELYRVTAEEELSRVTAICRSMGVIQGDSLTYRRRRFIQDDRHLQKIRKYPG